MYLRNNRTLIEICSPLKSSRANAAGAGIDATADGGTRAVLFDLDGVLVDSEGIYTEFWQQVDARFATNVPDFAHIIKGNTLENILEKYFDPEVHPAILQMLRQQENEMQYRLFEGVADLLENLRANHFKIAVVTSSNGRKMMRLLAEVPQIARAADIVVTGDDVTQSKPSPQGYLLAAQMLQCHPANCTVVEDSVAGLRAGRAAGCRVIGVASTLPMQALQGLADVYVSRPGDIKLSDL